MPALDAFINSVHLTQKMRGRFLVGLLLLISYLVEADEHDHMYEIDEEVVLWMNTSSVVSLVEEIICKQSVDIVVGKTNTKKTVFCKMKLTNEAYQTFVYAIKNSYFYQMYLDDMPIW
ncbi:hypothetical protein TELCIR_19755, partial [Teladorsagia circumcincta]